MNRKIYLNNSCLICNGSFSAAGDHSLVSLECGDLFGKKCIENWLRKHSSKRCYSCDQVLNKTDLHIINSRLLLTDTNQTIERLQAELKKEKNLLLESISREETYYRISGEFEEKYLSNGLELDEMKKKVKFSKLTKYLGFSSLVLILYFQFKLSSQRNQTYLKDLLIAFFQKL